MSTYAVELTLFGWGSMSPMWLPSSDRLNSRNGRGLVKRRRPRHCFLYAPGSNPGKTPGDRREAQKELL